MKDINFEESLTRLEEITQNMESGDLTLDASLKLFEEGIKLSRFCEKKLTDAQLKIEVLQSTDITEEESDQNDILDNDEDIDPPKRKHSSKKKNLMCSTDEQTGEEESDDTNFLF